MHAYSCEINIKPYLVNSLLTTLLLYGTKPIELLWEENVLENKVSTDSRECWDLSLSSNVLQAYYTSLQNIYIRKDKFSVHHDLKRDYSKVEPRTAQ